MSGKDLFGQDCMHWIGDSMHNKDDDNNKK